MKLYQKSVLEVPIGEPTLENRKSIAVFASGNGSNAENLFLFEKERQYLIKIKCLICDKSNAFVIQRAHSFKIPYFICPYRGDNDEQEKQILHILNEFQIEWICLAGYMKILSRSFIEKFYDKNLGVSRILNIHPSLLPKFKGNNAYKRAFDSQDQWSGITVHFVDEGIDTGPIIIQSSFRKYENDKFEDFVKRGQEVEYKIYRKALDLVLSPQTNITI
jgi:phosphoribosylglycinamide formyltransferase 1